MLQWDAILLDKRLTFIKEPVFILASHVRWLHSIEIIVDKVQWKHHQVDEATLAIEREIRAQYPNLFKASGTFYSFTFVDKSFFSVGYYNDPLDC